MHGEARWVIAAVTGVIGVAGLFMSAHAEDAVSYYGGLAMLVFCVLLIFYWIKDGFDTTGEAGGGD